MSKKISYSFVFAAAALTFASASKAQAELTILQVCEDLYGKNGPRCVNAVKSLFDNSNACPGADVTGSKKNSDIATETGCPEATTCEMIEFAAKAGDPGSGCGSG